MARKHSATKASDDAGSAAMQAMADLQAAWLGPMTAMGTTMLENMADMGNEVTQFIAERMQEDVKTQHRILHCKDPHELHAIHAEFVQKAIDQYTAETGKLVEMSNDWMASAFKAKSE